MLGFFCVHLCLPMQEQYHGGSGHKVRASASSFWQIELDQKLKNNQYRLDQSFFYNSTGLHLHTSRFINLHPSVYISAYACTKSLIFYLHQSTWGGYWTPIPMGSCPTATQDLCAPKPTLVNKYKTSKYWVTAGLQEWQVSHLHWQQRGVENWWSTHYGMWPFEAHLACLHWIGIKPASPLSHIHAPTTNFGCQWW
jgi:hypothetical protein